MLEFSLEWPGRTRWLAVSHASADILLHTTGQRISIRLKRLSSNREKRLSVGFLIDYSEKNYSIKMILLVLKIVVSKNWFNIYISLLIWFLNVIIVLNSIYLVIITIKTIDDIYLELAIYTRQFSFIESSQQSTKQIIFS